MKPFGPVHENDVTLPVPINEVIGLVQVRFKLPALMPTVGVVLFSVIITLAVAVQPFAPVTVTLYAPAELAVIVEVVKVPAPDQA